MKITPLLDGRGCHKQRSYQYNINIKIIISRQFAVDDQKIIQIFFFFFFSLLKWHERFRFTQKKQPHHVPYSTVSLSPTYWKRNSFTPTLSPIQKQKHHSETEIIAPKKKKKFLYFLVFYYFQKKLKTVTLCVSLCVGLCVWACVYKYC